MRCSCSEFVLWCLCRAVPITVGLTTFAVFALSGGVLTAASAFTSLALFDILQFPLSMFPRVITNR